MSQEISEKKDGKIPFYKMDLVFTIVERGLGDKLAKMMKSNDVLMNYVCPGRGTATSGILEIMGIGATEKDVMISFVRCDRTKDIISKLCESMNFSKPGTGISFSVPLESIIGTRALKLISEGQLAGGEVSNG